MLGGTREVWEEHCRFSLCADSPLLMATAVPRAQVTASSWEPSLCSQRHGGHVCRAAVAHLPAVICSSSPEHAFRKLRCLQCGELWHRQGHGRKQGQTVFAVWDTRLSLCGPILCPRLQLWRQAQ